MSFTITSNSALAPDSPIPTQLRQANAALSHLLNKGISPANIVLGGDSAGGNLILQLMSHILHPLPSIPPSPALSQALAGAMLISPWCKYNTDGPSFARNDRKDVLTARCYVHFMAIGTTGLTPELEYYCQPISAPASWWKGLDGVCSRVLVTAGEHEVMLDQIIETGTMISHYVEDTVTRVEPEALHEEVILKFATSEGGTGKEYDAMVGFLSRAFRPSGVEVR
jgi:acetyl esterase/lipase